MSNDTFAANWNYPTSVKVGNGRIKELPDICRLLAIKSPLIVTDPGLTDLPPLTVLLSICKAENLPITIFTRIKGNPTGENIQDGVATYYAGQHDGVIAIGGGSALDAGKAIALMVGQNRPIWDFEDIGDNWKRVNTLGMAPVVAIPTTAGTGSEVGRASVITDPVHQVKKIIFHPNMLPKVVILDPGLTIGLSPSLTAATGMDALSHNLEAYCSNYYHPMAKGIAIEGIRLIKENLAHAVSHGDDLQARMQMLVASSMGATAFQCGLGAMHALAHPLGAIYDAHHGRLNAILMPYVLLANREAIENKIVHLATCLGIQNGFEGFLNWIIQLRNDIGIEHRLLDIGIDTEQRKRIAKMAIEDASASSNPIHFSALQYEEIFDAAVHGKIK